MTTPTSTAEAPQTAPTAGPSPNDIVYLNGPVIRFAMRVRGWSQAGLSRLLGVSESTLSRALRGEATTWRVVRTLLDAFDERLAVEEVAILPGISRPLPDGVRDVDPE